ncbi:MAG: DUF1538 domain-containing protein [Euryarchaeota archaeon]|nr:DUF1538 domain-containing protein [Euryarchaeota archaeon]MBU4608840.1 DUF1538 domain-containing protein [Euryarchaeota archaeon]MBV1729271.1 DUF1538 domain-containing protein [Methanobacterium sp.]MBV1755777.1 DUF1538 domain-containing protein [Methanobacterium sp.]MBV1766881.1 DUF1538 domain-containing protein [Methanobacterium sp.]
MDPLGALEIFKEVVEAILPVLILFFIFQVLILRKIPQNIMELLSGVFMTIIGFFFFFWGAKLSLIPMGTLIGNYLSGVNYTWVIIFTFIVGIFSILAEPAVNVFVYEVEKVSSGYLRKNLMILSIALGVGFALFFSALRIYLEIPLALILIPGYVLILCLVIFTPKDFIPIAFDSGAVATGPMVVTFALPIMTSIAIGLKGEDSGLLGLGTVGLVAMFPIIFILVLGIILKKREKDE